MDPIAETRAWIEHFVVALGLCPFAAGPLGEGRVRLVESRARTAAALRDDLARELVHLARTPAAAVETTLLVHPFALKDFDAFNQFLDEADRTVEEAGLVGVIQVASFHPQYRFAGTEPSDVANATNRSPHPTLHLLREASVERAVATHVDTTSIPRRNVALLRTLGAEAVRRLIEEAGREAASRLRRPGRRSRPNKTRREAP